MRKFLELIDKLLFYFLLAFLAAFPSLFSRMCYSHCLAPKEFALYAGAGAGGTLLAVLFAARRPAGYLKVPAVALLAGLFLASLSLSLVSTPAFELSLYRLHYYIVLGLWAALYMYSSYENPERGEAFLTALLLSGIFPAAVIIGEAFGIGALKIWQNVDATGLTTRQTYVSTFGNPDFAAPFFGVMCALNIRFILFRGEGVRRHALWALQFLYAASLFIPLCRSSQIAFASFLVFYYLLIGKAAPKKLPMLQNVIVSFVAVIFFIQLKDMLSGTGESLLTRAYDLFFSGETASKRLYMLAVGAEIIKANFYTGGGLNAMLMVFPQYAQLINQSSPLWDGIPHYFNPSHLHNEFFNIFAECGVVAFVLFALLATSLIYFPARAALRGGEKGEQAAIAACAVAYILVDSCFNVTLSLPHMALAFAVAGALGLNWSNFDRNQYFSFDFTGGFYRLTAGLLIALFALLSAVFGIKYIKADWCLMQGRFYDVSRDKLKALEFYAMASGLFAQRAEPYVFSADIYRETGRFQEAAGALIKATNINLSLPIVYELAQIAIRHMDLNSEFRYLYFLTRSYPRFDEAHYLLGLRYLKEKTVNPNAYAEAEKCLKRAITLKPKHISARMTLAELYYETRRYREAAVQIDAALAVSPSLRNAIYLRSLMKGFIYDEF